MVIGFATKTLIRLRTILPATQVGTVSPQTDSSSLQEGGAFSNNVSLPIPRADFLGHAPSLLPFFVFPNRRGSLESACVTGWIVIRGLISFFTAGTI